MKKVVFSLRLICLALSAGLLAAAFSVWLSSEANAAIARESGACSAFYTSGFVTPADDEPDSGEGGNTDEDDGEENDDTNGSDGEEGDDTDETADGENDPFAPDSIFWIFVGIDGGLLLLLILIGIATGIRKKKRKANALK